MKNKFKIKGLDCANCAAKLEAEIQKIEGINEASISLWIRLRKLLKKKNQM